MPCISRWMRYINCQFLDRENVREGLKTILNCIELIKKGTSIFLFPEGTRGLGGEMLPFKDGGFKIATKTGLSDRSRRHKKYRKYFRNPYSKGSEADGIHRIRHTDLYSRNDTDREKKDSAPLSRDVFVTC